MKINIISFSILLGFISTSVAVRPGLESDLEQKLVNEIDEFYDDRPEEIQELEEGFEDGMDTFIKEGFKGFKNIATYLNKHTKSFDLSSTEFDETEFKKIDLLTEKFSTFLEKFKGYFKSIRELNDGLMDQLKEVYDKITTVSFDKPIEPEEDIGRLSVGSSSTFEENNMEDNKETLIDIIPVISQAMTCRFTIVYTVNWIRVRLEYIENKAEWMAFREELVKLMQTYNAIEMNVSEYLTSFNEMISNPDQRDDSKVKKVMDYFKETIEEETFISKTEDLIKIMSVLKIKPASIETIETTDDFDPFDDLDFHEHRFDENPFEMTRLEQTEQEVQENMVTRPEDSIDGISSINRELLLDYFDVCHRGMKDKLTSIRDRMRRDRGRYRHDSTSDQNDYSNNLNQLERQMDIIRSTLVSSNNFNEMVAQTLEAKQTLMDQRVITEDDSQPLNTFVQDIQDILEQEYERIIIHSFLVSSYC